MIVVNLYFVWPIVMGITAVHLIESELRRGGAVYVVRYTSFLGQKRPFLFTLSQKVGNQDGIRHVLE